MSLIDANTQHQVMTVRMAAGQAELFMPSMEEAKDFIRAKLLEAGDLRTKAELKRVTSEIKDGLRDIYGGFTSQLEGNFDEIIANELQFQHSSVAFELDVQPNQGDKDAALRLAYSRPMGIGQMRSAVFFADWLAEFPEQEAERVANRVVMGFSNGETTVQMAQAITGTKNQTGLINITRANAFTLAKTGVTQLSVSAKDEFNKRNRHLIGGYEIIATLDEATSTICRSLDGQIFEYTDEYQPHPPFHPNCRTTEAPIVDKKFRIERDGTRPAIGADGVEEVSENLTYYSWLKRQPASFQDEVLGNTKGLIFRNSGLTPEQFRKASVDSFNNPLTIEQMAAQDSMILSYLNKKK
jgi:SPP1 gp7 family putative phage head morphogenesis protein